MKFSQILGQIRPERMLLGAIANDKVANAYLFIGPDEVLKHKVALAFASALNCENYTGDSCGTCKSCHKIEKGVHPDVLIIAPQDSSNIKIDQIRDLISYTRYGPSEGRWKVCIIDDAASMTLEAANSFLKTLEEPLPNIVFVLLAASDVGIPQTLISRCQKTLFAESLSQSPENNEGEIRGEVEWIYNELHSISQKDITRVLKLSSRIDEYGEDVEGVLESLMSRFWSTKSGSLCRPVKIILQALAAIKKRANVRLALDVMCLRLGEAINVKENGH